MLHLIRKKSKRVRKTRKYENVVEAFSGLRFYVKLIGASVFSIQSAPGNIIISTFTRMGFALFLFWHASYFYAAYSVFFYEETVLRSYYDTKLKYYGDVVENLTTTLYVIYAMWKIPFYLSMDVKSMQLIVDIDKAIEGLGQHMDYSKHDFISLALLLIQLTITSTRVLVVSIPLKYLNYDIPLEKLFHMAFFDSVAFIITSYYCIYLYLVRIRYKKVNKILGDIKDKSCQEFFMFRVRKEEITEGAVRLQDKYVSEKIKDCGKVYGMLYEATEIVNSVFAISIWLTMGVCLLFIILYLYYFMEATVSGLFHNPERYIDFLGYVLWQIGFALIIIFLYIYCSEITVKEARVTPNLTHAIINSDLDAVIKAEATNLSMQVLHQTPIFSGCGFHKLDYELILEGARSVVTFLVMLLQFVADSRSD